MPHLHSKRALTAGFFLAASLGTASPAQTDITIGMQLEPPHLDPTSAAAGAIDNVVYSNIFEGLTRFMGDGSVVPGLAKRWDISDDGLRYTFHLQSDVRFHDGTVMDAEDVKFSLDRARAEDSTNAQKALFDHQGLHTWFRGKSHGVLVPFGIDIGFRRNADEGVTGMNDARGVTQ